MKLYLAIITMMVSCCTAVASADQQSCTVLDSLVVENDPEHFPSAFDAEKLETATKLKYVGVGISVAGIAAASGGETETGLLLSAVGAVMSLFGIISQDIQLVRLGWKHQKKPFAAYTSPSAKTSPNGASYESSDSGFAMGDVVSFKLASGAFIRGEVVGIVTTPSDASGWQIIVRYEYEGTFKTSTLAPSMLSKVQED